MQTLIKQHVTSTSKRISYLNSLKVTFSHYRCGRQSTLWQLRLKHATVQPKIRPEVHFGSFSVIATALLVVFLIAFAFKGNAANRQVGGKELISI